MTHLPPEHAALTHWLGAVQGSPLAPPTTHVGVMAHPVHALPAPQLVPSKAGVHVPAQSGPRLQEKQLLGLHVVLQQTPCWQ
jgi:hypothetical protein